MRRSLAVPLAVTIAVFSLTPALAHRHSGRVKSGRVKFEGTAVALAPWNSTFSVHVDRSGFALVTVWVQSFTRFEVDRRRDTRRGSLRDLRVGDRVEVEGLRLDDGRVLALKVEVEGRRDATAGRIATGVIVLRGPNVLTVLQRDGSSLRVWLTDQTRVVGQRQSVASLSHDDIVNVRGTVGDGALVARQIEVTFAAATSIGGVVTAKNSPTRLLILNGLVAVDVAGDVFLISGGRLGSFEEIPLGSMVTVWGAPASGAGIGGSFRARVIVY
ncbi:MAG: DUF5666 domain-containing protein [Armatimonadota bacterium]|nr:DUF5666 domain-containing protein [Armatimonadota bacterium]MDR5697324.1 DUF5666 domain-containing protein [Armatimonadota bacterium]